MFSTASIPPRDPIIIITHFPDETSECRRENWIIHHTFLLFFTSINHSYFSYTTDRTCDNNCIQLINFQLHSAQLEQQRLIDISLYFYLIVLAHKGTSKVMKKCLWLKKKNVNVNEERGSKNPISSFTILCAANLDLIAFFYSIERKNYDIAFITVSKIWWDNVDRDH